MSNGTEPVQESPVVVQLPDFSGTSGAVFETGEAVGEMKVNAPQVYAFLVKTGYIMELHSERVFRSVLTYVWRQSKRKKPDGPVVGVWSTQVEPGKWLIKAKQEGELVSPFPRLFGATGKTWGAWLSYTEQLLEGKAIQIPADRKVLRAIGQSFRAGCGVRGIELPRGRVLKRRELEDGRWELVAQALINKRPAAKADASAPKKKKRASSK